MPPNYEKTSHKKQSLLQIYPGNANILTTQQRVSSNFMTLYEYQTFEKGV